ncbi:MAG TPA: hypothetical protein V6D13_17600 [Halomicronema sp.]
MLKPTLTSLTTALILLTAIPVKAGKFETQLQEKLTPEEAQVHQQIGNAKANQIALDACTAFDNGATVTEFATQIVLGMISEGGTQEQMLAKASYSGKVIGVGVENFCPKHLQKLQETQVPIL